MEKRAKGSRVMRLYMQVSAYHTALASHTESRDLASALITSSEESCLYAPLLYVCDNY